MIPSTASRPFRLALQSLSRINEQVVSGLATSTLNLNKPKYKQQQVEQPVAWQSVVKEAEKVVGYSTSFLNLRWLLSDEIANIAQHLRRLVGTEHPLLTTAKDFFINNSNQGWGLVVLLVSKAGGIKPDVNVQEWDKVAGIMHSQRVLAEITDMIRLSVILHKTLLNVGSSMKDQDTLTHGNKLALLSGDYLLSKSFLDLAQLRNPNVNNIISSTLRDFSECEFLGLRDSQNKPIPSEPKIPQAPINSIISDDTYDLGPYDIARILGNPMEEWALHNVLSGGNLLAKSCQCALILSGQSMELQKNAFLFGKQLALAWHLRRDLGEFQNSPTYSLMCAPVMMHLQHDPSLYEEIKKGRDDVQKCDFEKIRLIVESGTAMDKLKQLHGDMRDRTLKKLDNFVNSGAKDALRKIVLAL